MNFLFYNLFFILKKKTKVFHMIFRFFPSHYTDRIEKCILFTRNQIIYDCQDYPCSHFITVTSFLLHMNYNFLPYKFRFSIEFMVEIQNSISSQLYPSIELSDNRLKLLIHKV